MSLSLSKDRQFRILVAEAANCSLCPQMRETSAVLSELNGNIHARIMFVGEAPGRKGADRTRIPFFGDKSGVNFDRFLASIALKRDDIFITSAALCNPRTDSGANRKPSLKEINNCSSFLTRTIAIVNPDLVVTLGSVALHALKAIAPHELTLKTGVATINDWNSRLLVPIYHPSPQVLASHRREAEQLSDYQAIRRAIELINANAGSNRKSEKLTA